MISPNLMEVRVIIAKLCSETDEHMCRRAITDLRVRLQKVVRQYSTRASTNFFKNL